MTVRALLYALMGGPRMVMKLVPGTPLLPASWLPFRLVTPVPLTVSEYLPILLSFVFVVRVTVMVVGS